MTKREVSLRRRLHLAHSFIGAMKARAKDYGSAFSSDVHYDCARFLEDNKPVNESKFVLVLRDEWQSMRIQKLRAIINDRKLNT